MFSELFEKTPGVVPLFSCSIFSVSIAVRVGRPFYRTQDTGVQLRCPVVIFLSWAVTCKSHIIAHSHICQMISVTMTTNEAFRISYRHLGHVARFVDGSGVIWGKLSNIESLSSISTLPSMKINNMSTLRTVNIKITTWASTDADTIIDLTEVRSMIMIQPR